MKLHNPVCFYSGNEISWAYPWRRYVTAIEQLGIKIVNVDHQRADNDGDAIVVGSWHFLHDQLPRLEVEARGWLRMIRFYDDWRGDIASQIKRAVRGKPNVGISQISGMDRFDRYRDIVSWQFCDLCKFGILPGETPLDLHAAQDLLLYYGAFKADRLSSMQMYNDPRFAVSSSRKGVTKWGATIDKAVYYERFDLPEDLRHFRRHLYVEDSGKNYPDHTPSNRFWELLSLRAPIFFDVSTVKTMTNYCLTPWPIVSNIHEVYSYDPWEVQKRQEELYGKLIPAESRNYLRGVLEV